MNILAVDSSSSIASVSLYKNEKTYTKINEDSLTHSQKLLPLITSILEENNVTNNDIDLYVSSKGPGSFTGIRIGVSTVKALAHVTKKDIVSFTSLDMLAQNVINESEYICAVIDARNENAYYGIYKTNGTFLENICENSCENIDVILEKCTSLNKKILFVGDASVNFREKILQNSNFNCVEDLEKNKQNSSSLIELFLNNKDVAKENYAEFKPIYFRASQAERNIKK